MLCGAGVHLHCEGGEVFPGRMRVPGPGWGLIFGGAADLRH